MAQSSQIQPTRPLRKVAGPRVKPAKPYLDFPLFPHATGRWAKKIRGRFAFFGPWEDPQGALERYLAERDALQAGFVPRPATSGHGAPRGGRGVQHGGLDAARHGVNTGGLEGSGGGPDAAAQSWGPVTAVDGLTLRELANHFLSAKQRRVAAGEISVRAFNDLHRTCEYTLKALGKDRRVDDLSPTDFGRLREALGKGRGPLTLSIHIQKVRSIFKHGFDSGLMDKPVRFGPEFKKPAMRTIRLARRAKGERMFEPEDIRRLMGAAGVQMRAMILLGLNAGMGNSDLAALPREAVDLKKGELEFPRPKTGIPRRAILWKETVEALRRVEKARPKAKNKADAGLVFLTKYGHPWVRAQAPGERSKGKSRAVLVDAVNLEFSKLTRELNLARPGRGFYALRHTFRTIADEVGDRPAVDLIMGHQDGSDIATHYVERIADERLRKVADHVRAWSNLPVH